MARVTFVDEDDRVVGEGDRAEALEKGIPHRIVRVHVISSAGLLLLQKRAPGLPAEGKWDGSAAGHVDAGEEYVQAAQRELKEELGIVGTLEPVTKFYTEGPDGATGGVRRRFQMLYRTTHDGPFVPSPREVAEIRWFELEGLKRMVAENPDDFTAGFKISLWYI